MRRGTVCLVRNLGHVPALDGLRGIAILLVLGVHVKEIVPGGLLGVDLFFVLSGFLITSLLLNEHAATGTISLPAFYRRRALRLFPAFVVMIGVFLALVAIFSRDELGQSAIAAGFGITYLANIAQAAGGLFDAAELTPLWSLATEEQFYLLWPPILFLTLRRGVSTRTIIGALALLALASCAWRIVLLSNGATTGRVWLAPDSHADPILIGCVAGVVYTTARFQRLRFAELALIISAGIIAMSGWGRPEMHGLLLPFVIACAIVMLAVALDPNWWFSRILAVPPLRYLGRISYGLYLWHVPILLAFGWKVGLPLAVIVAALSHRFVEKPFLRRKYQRVLKYGSFTMSRNPSIPEAGLSSVHAAPFGSASCP